MKKTAIFALLLILVCALCACRMGGNEATVPSQSATTPAPTVPTVPVTEAPTQPEPVIDPTLNTNIPDPSVDNEHLMEPTQDSTAMPDPDASMIP